MKGKAFLLLMVQIHFDKFAENPCFGSRELNEKSKTPNSELGMVYRAPINYFNFYLISILYFIRVNMDFLSTTDNEI